jgi:hypothetical protein
MDGFGSSDLQLVEYGIQSVGINSGTFLSLNSQKTSIDREEGCRKRNGGGGIV